MSQRVPLTALLVCVPGDVLECVPCSDVWASPDLSSDHAAVSSVPQRTRLYDAILQQQ